LLIPLWAFCQPTEEYFNAQNNLRNYNITFYHLNILVDPEAKFISGNNTICFIRRKNQDTIELDLGPQFLLEKITQNNQALLFTRDSASIKVRLIPDSAIPNCIVVHYRGTPKEAQNAPWDGGAVWAKDSLHRYWSGIAVQNDGAQLWWPCKDSWYDRPDSMRLSFRCKEPLKIIGNGKLISETKEDTVYSSEWKISNPILPYNVSFYIGHYKHFRKSSKNRVLTFYAIDYNKSAAKKHFKQCETIVDRYSELFGEYPFHNDGFKVVEAPYWGMEHQTAVAYGNHFRNDVLGYDFILLHEIAHEWWGNHISAIDPAYMWIHEAMATYSEALFFEKVYDKEQSIRYLLHQKKNIENKKTIEGIPHCRYHDYPDADMYYRGTWMMHTLRHHLNNDSLWFSMLKNIHASGMPTQYTGTQFEQYISQSLKLSLNDFFEYFIRSTKTPELYYRKNGGRIELKWKSIPPFTVWLKNEKLPITESYRTFELTDKELNSLQNFYYLNLMEE
jgi:aminopeptidase N